MGICWQHMRRSKWFMFCLCQKFLSGWFETSQQMNVYHPLFQQCAIPCWKERLLTKDAVIQLSAVITEKISGMSHTKRENATLGMMLLICNGSQLFGMNSSGQGCSSFSAEITCFYPLRRDFVQYESNAKKSWMTLMTRFQWSSAQTLHWICHKIPQCDVRTFDRQSSKNPQKWEDNDHTLLIPGFCGQADRSLVEDIVDQQGSISPLVSAPTNKSYALFGIHSPEKNLTFSLPCGWYKNTHSIHFHLGYTQTRQAIPTGYSFTHSTPTTQMRFIAISFVLRS